MKPGNLLLDADGTVKILDLGLARFSETANVGLHAELTGGRTLGTVDFMAPEQATSTAAADARSDVYSLGMTLFYLLSGQPAYGGSTVTARLLAHQKEPPPTLSDVQPVAPPWLQAVFERMVAKRPEDRFQSMDEVADALDRASVPQRRWPMHQTMMAIATACLVFGTIAASVWLATRPIRDANTVAGTSPGDISGTPRRSEGISEATPPPVREPKATDIAPRGLVARLDFDDLNAGWVRDCVSGRWIEAHGVRLDRGPVGNAATFGPNTWVSLGNEFSPELGEPFSICFWLRLDEHTGFGVPIAKFGDETGIKFQFPKHAGALAFQMSRRWPDDALYAKMPYATSGKWQFVCVTHDGTGTGDGVRLYLDGSQVGSVRIDKLTSSIKTPSPLRIGGLEGAVDEFRIYGRVLASEEIDELAEQGGVVPIGKRPPKPEPTGVVPAGLVTHLRFDEKDGWHVRDSVTGRFVGSVSSGRSWVDGVEGGAIQIDHDGRIGLGQTFSPANGQGFSVSLWARGGTNEERQFLIQQYVNEVEGYKLQIGDRADPRFRLVIPPNGKTVKSDSLPQLLTEWTHIVATYDGSGRGDGMRIYVNGVLAKAGPADRQFEDHVATDAPLVLGAGFRGALDDFRAYDRALTPDEVRQLWAARGIEVRKPEFPFVPRKAEFTGWPGGGPEPAVAPFDAETAESHRAAWVEHLGVPAEREITVGEDVSLPLSLIPPGEFRMGVADEQAAQEREKATEYEAQVLAWMTPQHDVRITRPFYIGSREVTRGAFRKFVEETGYRTVADRTGKGTGFLSAENKDFEAHPRFVWNADPESLGFAQTEEHPVVLVAWEDANAFCRWLSSKDESLVFTLPTEAEWEYACRAGTEGVRYFSADKPWRVFDEYAWHPANSNRGTHPVGQLAPNAWGLYDMYGNVRELCFDRWDDSYYETSPRDDPTGPDEGNGHVGRGEGWNDSWPYMRSAFRKWARARYGSVDAGFRVVGRFREGTVGAESTAEPQTVLMERTENQLVPSAKVGPHGRYIAAKTPPRETATITVWDARTGKALHTLDLHARPGTLEFDHSGKRLATVGIKLSQDGEPHIQACEVDLWDIETGEALASLQVSGQSWKFTWVPNSLRFSPNGKLLLTAGRVKEFRNGQLGWHGSVQLWDTATGRETLTMKDIPGSMAGAVFSPDGKAVIGWTTATVKGSTLLVWDSRTGDLRRKHSLDSSLGTIDSAKLVADGSTVLTHQSRRVREGDSFVTKRTSRLWRLADLEDSGEFESVQRSVLSSDGQRLFTIGMNGEIALWDARTLEKVRVLTTRGANTLSPDGSRAIVYGRDGVRAWKVE